MTALRLLIMGFVSFIYLRFFKIKKIEDVYLI